MCISMKNSDNAHAKFEPSEEEKIMLLYDIWSALLNEDDEHQSARMERFTAPHAPHFENCSPSAEMHKQFDACGENGSFPPWPLWRGLFGIELHHRNLSEYPTNNYFPSYAKPEGAYPPWVSEYAGVHWLLFQHS